MLFQDLGLSAPLLKAITEMGFESPTPIQEKAIPHLLNTEQDLIGLAQTGTGKTAAFGLPLLERCDPQLGRVQGIILSPTRELCVQIGKELESFGKYSPGLRVRAVYGGAPIGPQIRSVKSNPAVITATPGRLLDLIRREVVDFSAVNTVVLDEADQMLHMGFKDELDGILEALPAERRNVLLSATMPAGVARIARTYMNDPEEIAVASKNIGTEQVDHKCLFVRPQDRFEAVKRIVDRNPSFYGIVFCRTRAATQEVADRLSRKGYDAEALHGDLSQAQRDWVMKRFRDKVVKILVATDIAARGIDVRDLTHVIHYDLPEDTHSYNHRSGRTGRAGQTGISYALATRRDMYRIKEIERNIKRPLVQEQAPNREDILKVQTRHLFDEVIDKDAQEEYELASLLCDKRREALQELTKDELIEKFLAFQMGPWLSYYDKREDLPEMDMRSPRYDRNRTGSRDFRDNRRGYDRPGNFTTVRVNLGRSEGVLPPDLISLVNRCTRGKKVQLGRIDIRPGESYIQVEADKGEWVVQEMANLSYQGKQLECRAVAAAPGGGRYSGGNRHGGGNRYGGGGNRYNGGRPRQGGFDRRGPRSGGSERRFYNN